MRIVLIEPESPGIHIFHKFRLPRLGALLLGTIMEELGHDCEVQFEVAAPLDFESMRKADLVGISTITPTAPRSYAIADMLRLASVPVVIGGPHVTFCSEEALEHAGYVVRGEGEAALPALVEAMEAGGEPRDLEKVPNLSWRGPDGSITHNPVAPPTVLDDLPTPDWSLVQAGISATGLMSYNTAPMQTSRGCPYDCTFCSVTEMFGRKMRYRSVEGVLDSVRPYNQRGMDVFFYDDNFAANRNRVEAICEGILSAGMKRLTWSAQVRADIARDPKLVKLMHRAGARTFYIGLESAHEDSLKSMNKKQTVATMRENLRTIRNAGVRVHGMFVFGFDQDSPESMDATVRFAVEEKLSSAQFLLLVPLPGTRTYQELEDQGRIVLTDWSLYDGHHAVFQPRGVGMRDLQQAQLDAHARFYSRRRELGWILKGRVVEALIAEYARALNHRWEREKTVFLSWLRQIDSLGVGCPA